MSQQDKILLFFKANPNKSFTPFEVCQVVFNNSCPVTSVRRSITNLEHSGELVKLKERRNGDYGVLNYLWKLKPSEKLLVQASLF